MSLAPSSLADARNQGYILLTPGIELSQPTNLVLHIKCWTKGARFDSRTILENGNTTLGSTCSTVTRGSSTLAKLPGIDQDYLRFPGDRNHLGLF